MFSSFLEQHKPLPTKKSWQQCKIIFIIHSNSSIPLQSDVFEAGLSYCQVTVALISSFIERKITLEKVREHSENRPEHLEFSMTIILFYMKRSKGDWTNALNSMKRFRYANV